MKSQKGITLTSLVIYIMVVLVVAGILATIITNFEKNYKTINKEATSQSEFDKFNIYFIKEVKISGNKINTISDNEIIFESGNKYTFNQEDNKIYLNNDIKISENIEKCTFSNNLVNGKDIITVVIKVIDGEERTVEYTLNSDSSNLGYDNETNYVYQTNNMSWYEDLKAGTVTRGKVTLNIGDYVDYKPDQATYASTKLGSQYTGTSSSSNLTTEDLKWRILGVDNNGCLMLISDKPTSKMVSFTGAKGYNNGVYILNDICAKLYSKTELGATARSLTVEDVEAGFNDTGINARNNYTVNSSGAKYGETKTYTTNLNYPVIYAQENGSGIEVTEDKVESDIKKDGIGGSNPYYSETQLTQKTDNKESNTANSAITCTQTGYVLSISDTNTYCVNNKFYEMIFKAKTSAALGYWLASRAIDCGPAYANFGFLSVNTSSLSCLYLFKDDGTAGTGQIESLRPVVTLPSDVIVTKYNGTNSESNMHTLSKVSQTE